MDKRKLKEYIKKNNVEEKPEVQELPYKTTKINNRRYLGNKYKLLPFITEVIEKECENVNTVADIIAGTGAVASAFTDRKIITNDIMYSNYICHVAWFSSEDYSEDKIIDLIVYYNNKVVEQDIPRNYKKKHYNIQDFDNMDNILHTSQDNHSILV